MGEHTRVGNLDLNHAALEGFSIQSQGLPEAVGIGKLNITKALRTLHLAVLNDANAGNIAAFEELSHRLHRGIVGEVAQVSSIRGLLGELLWDAFVYRVSCSVSIVANIKDREGTHLGQSKRTCRHWRERGRSAGAAGCLFNYRQYKYRRRRFITKHTADY